MNTKSHIIVPAAVAAGVVFWLGALWLVGRPVPVTSISYALGAVVGAVVCSIGMAVFNK